ncbi:hypothetical protein SDRG_13660 [Saprolegnia diclina VS20]|uniref:CHCH domain-containing protein n=2 Tax=Saprolegnia TaxID=4769 RepID=A0A067C568_SAPPC|nr:hypothetical protein SDRG_13660 [Saprolegnia diclina VS20]XP_012203487.1 hypothetical protein SPRG_08870 [Saprolegnia parasitica CBS 223.65]EQC28584.1 hypothetical protein SDRG_13660 [Saprolegnia diclina VS20]KDO25929.1 hypothetical protein SPRG_08870 [Saprolegnia parasitica CBS 223.65]|eukprot:XP_008617981.1 hypothetical protein SDRG_13660 [Saprolegnia diclina VS20]
MSSEVPVMSMTPTQFEMGECTKLQRESLKCIEENYRQRDKCNEFFERYRECKKGRHAAIIAARRAGKLD